MIMIGAGRELRRRRLARGDEPRGLFTYNHNVYDSNSNYDTDNNNNVNNDVNTN